MEAVTSRIFGGTPLVSTKRISKRNSFAYSVTSALWPDQISAELFTKATVVTSDPSSFTRTRLRRDSRSFPSSTGMPRDFSQYGRPQVAVSTQS